MLVRSVIEWVKMFCLATLALLTVDQHRKHKCGLGDPLYTLWLYLD
jgi:hypothetical protein